VKTRIYIGTASGPVQVERIWREEGIAESMVCLRRTTEMLPIGAGYDAFVKRPSGVIEREFGPFEPGAFRLDLSATINQGKSWQLAVLAAHALARHGMLAGPDDAFERAVWLTGEVDNDLKVGGVTQVPEKIHGALPALTALVKEGVEVLLYVPEDNAEALAGADLPAGISGNAVATASEILNSIGVDLAWRKAGAEENVADATSGQSVDRPAVRPNLRPNVQPDVQPVAGRARRGRTLIGLTILLLGAAAIAAGVIIPDQLTSDEPLPLSSDPAPETSEDEQTASVPEPEALGGEDPDAEASGAKAPLAEPSADEPATIIVENAGEQEPAPSTKSSPPAADTTPSLSIFEVSAPVAGGCPAVHFGAEGGVMTTVPPVSPGEFKSSAADDLCAIEFRMLAPPDQPYMAAAIELISGRYVESEITPISLRGGTAAGGPVVWRINLPLRMKAPLEYRLHMVSGEVEIVGEVRRSLVSGNISAAVEAGLSLLSVHHLVAQ
jgi:hypothetical protein